MQIGVSHRHNQRLYFCLQNITPSATAQWLAPCMSLIIGPDVISATKYKNKKKLTSERENRLVYEILFHNTVLVMTASSARKRQFYSFLTHSWNVIFNRVNLTGHFELHLSHSH